MVHFSLVGNAGTCIKPRLSKDIEALQNISRTLFSFISPQSLQQPIPCLISLFIPVLLVLSGPSVFPASQSIVEFLQPRMTNPSMTRKLLLCCFSVYFLSLMSSCLGIDFAGIPMCNQIRAEQSRRGKEEEHGNLPPMQLCLLLSSQ